MITLFRKIAGKLNYRPEHPMPAIDPETAYDQWALSYDAQPGNLLLHLEAELFGKMMQKLSVTDKVMVDIGCGTGRHWPLLLNKKPASLTGFDLSEGMLSILIAKYPGAFTVKLDDEHLALPDASCDILLSTLALAHMPDVTTVFSEWTRVLRPGGEILLTDFHPLALQRGSERTFLHEGKKVSVKNHIHPLQQIRSLAAACGLHELNFSESCIDASVKNWYEKQGALAVYERSRDTPVVYGLHLKKKHAAA